MCWDSSSSSIFQSTLSVRRATQAQLGTQYASQQFQSTLSVRRATRSKFSMLLLENSFQSTLSVRRATIEGVESRETHDISIHALRKESDHHPRTSGMVHRHFNPRSP